MEEESQSGDDKFVATSKGGEMGGGETIPARLRKELGVIHRVFRHDFRNELNLLIGHAEQAKAKTNDPEVAEAIDQTLADAGKLMETVERVGRIQDLASTEATPHAVNLAPTLHSLIREYDEQTPATFDVNVPETLWVWTNPSYELALDELIENAVIHNDTPDPKVTVEAHEGQRTDVIIADNGPGMPAGTKASLESEDVQQTDHLTSLGLWIAYWVVTRSGGTIAIEDNDPRGCRIRLSLRPARGLST